MSIIHDCLSYAFAPFTELAFMRRALAACFALSLSSAPLGAMLTLRRMSLVGDATAHAVLPGVAAAYLLAGPSMLAMTAVGCLSALSVAVLASLAARVTLLREDASFAAFYLIALATGVLLVSVRGNQVDLLHMLFGSMLAIDRSGLLLVASIATVTLVALALSYRALVVDAFDASFIRAHGRGAHLYHLLFVTLVVLNLVAGFQALGTLMSVGLMMLPALTARFWAVDLPWMLAGACLTGALATFLGLVLSFHLDVPAGPSIVLTAGLLCGLSALFAPQGLLPVLARRRAHPIPA